MNHACKHRQESIADYVLGALSDEQAEALRRHLNECPGCRQYLQQLESENAALIACGERVKVDMASRCDKVIEALDSVAPAPAGATRIVPLLGRLTRMAAAAALILGTGIAIGRFTGPRPVDVEQLRADVQASVTASLRPTVEADLTAEVDRRLEAALTAQNTQLTGAVAEQMRQDLRLLAGDLMSGTRTLVDRRFAEVVQLIEAGRQTDRQQVAKALYQIRTQTGMGLMRLASLTEETPATLQD